MSAYKDTIHYILDKIEEGELPKDALVLWAFIVKQPQDRRKIGKFRMLSALRIYERGLRGAIRGLIKYKLMDVELQQGKTTEYTPLYVNQPTAKQSPTAKKGVTAKSLPTAKRGGTNVAAKTGGTPPSLYIYGSDHTDQTIQKDMIQINQLDQDQSDRSEDESVEREEKRDIELDDMVLLEEEDEKKSFKPSGRIAKKVQELRKKIMLQLERSPGYNTGVQAKHFRKLIRLAEQVDVEDYARWYVSDKIKRDGKNFSWGLFLYPSMIEEYKQMLDDTSYLRTTSNWKGKEAECLAKADAILKRAKEADREIARKRKSKVKQAASAGR